LTGGNNSFLLFLLKEPVSEMNYTARMMMCYCAFLLCISCKNNTTAISPEKKAFSLTVNLPFESSNYENDTNFILKDVSGKYCIPSSDTVSKDGGTIIYDSLFSGSYTYSIKTIFRETVTKTVQLDKTTFIDLSAGDIYGNVNAITIDSLRTTASIDMILSGTALSTAIAIKKHGAKYLISFPGSTKKEQQRTIIKDSAATIKALIDMEVMLLGLQAMRISNDPFFFSYIPEMEFHMKTGYEYMSCIDVDQAWFNKIQRQFIKAIFENN
jgi:hypothetical protein